MACELGESHGLFEAEFSDAFSDALFGDEFFDGLFPEVRGLGLQCDVAGWRDGEGCLDSFFCEHGVPLVDVMKDDFAVSKDAKGAIDSALAWEMRSITAGS